MIYGRKKNPNEKDILFFSWIGFKDLNYVDSKIKNDIFCEHLNKHKNIRPTVSKASYGYSPIIKSIERIQKTGIELSEVKLFFDINDEVLGSQTRELVSRETNIDSAKIKVIYIEMDTNTAHGINEMMPDFLEKWNENTLPKDQVEVYFSLSSGTTAMNAMWLLVGKSKYPDAKYVQIDSEGNVGTPFQLDFNINEYALTNVFESIDMTAFDVIKGESKAIQQAKMLSAKAAKTDFNVLIFGESGTGKELFARAIHDSSQRAEKKFIAVNCATLSPQLAYSELFGHVIGAFTGADSNKEGLFEKYDKGTIFFDEIEALPLEVQAELLRTLQPPHDEKVTLRIFSRLGARDKDLRSDIRIIAATNEKLGTGNFRSDLLNRLAVLTIELPSLRSRAEDILILVNNYFEKLKEQYPVFKNKFLSKSAIKFIESHSWPGNVRQLQNALTQAIVFSDADEISAEDFGHLLKNETSVCETDTIDVSQECTTEIPSDIKSYLEMEDFRLKEHFMRLAFEKANGKKSEAAQLLGIPYQTWDNWKKALQKKGLLTDI